VLALAFSAALAFAVADLAAASCVLAAILVTGIAGVYFKRKIDGVSGDCLGAANQLVELACYLSLVAHLRVMSA
jgi:adenosylcobinamide-GDP ribazoletransferase